MDPTQHSYAHNVAQMACAADETGGVAFVVTRMPLCHRCERTHGAIAATSGRWRVWLDQQEKKRNGTWIPKPVSYQVVENETMWDVMTKKVGKGKNVADELTKPKPDSSLADEWREHEDLLDEIALKSNNVPPRRYWEKENAQMFWQGKNVLKPVEHSTSMATRTPRCWFVADYVAFAPQDTNASRQVQTLAHKVVDLRLRMPRDAIERRLGPAATPETLERLIQYRAFKEMTDRQYRANQEMTDLEIRFAHLKGGGAVDVGTPFLTPVLTSDVKKDMKKQSDAYDREETARNKHKIPARTLPLPSEERQRDVPRDEFGLVVSNDAHSGNRVKRWFKWTPRTPSNATTTPHRPTFDTDKH
eukprot:726173-Rhodomonas_salina.1